MILSRTMIPFNRHRLIGVTHDLEENKKIKYKLLEERKKNYISGKIIEKNKKIVKIDVGLEKVMEISRKELEQLKKVSRKEKKIGDNINIFIYKKQTTKGESVLNIQRLYRKIKRNNKILYKRYKRILFFHSFSNKMIKGIVLKVRNKDILIGIGGLIMKPVSLPQSMQREELTPFEIISKYVRPLEKKI